MANGLVIGAPRSGSGKTVLTLGLLAALKANGIAVASAKAGPDYIDAAILARVAGSPTLNLDAWAMSRSGLRQFAAWHAATADVLVIEGVMGLFDGAADGGGSTGDLAAALGLGTILVVDAERQSHSVAPLVSGFANWRADVPVVGLILNRVATTRHERMLRAALEPTGIPVLGAIPRRDGLLLPERHLGLVLPAEVAGFDEVVAAAASAVSDYVDLNRLLALSVPLAADGAEPAQLPPLGQKVAIARDDAFAFLYQHWLAGWREAGAELAFFSPLAGELPSPDSDAVLLPGGYPELHAGRLAEQLPLWEQLRGLRDAGALIYGECGGYMVMGETLTDASGTTWPMAGLLPVATRIDRPRRTLGYRRLVHESALPWPRELRGHEFHYSSGSSGPPPLFTATDALGETLSPLGAVEGRVLGSYAHVIGAAP